METLCVLVLVFGLAAALDLAKLQGGRIYQGPEAGVDQCGIDTDDRLQCGLPPTRDIRECRARGCCFRPCPNCDSGTPWCYKAKRMQTSQCEVAYEQKDDCGYWGITEGECLMRKCCYSPPHSGSPNEPWCFKPKSTMIRLVDGDNDREGRVEIYNDGEWGTVCDDGWDNRDASVACRSLGFASGRAYRGAAFGVGDGPILMDEMECTGDEAALEECRFNGWGEHDCSHSEDAGVKCSEEEGSGSDYAYYTNYRTDYRTNYITPPRPDYYDNY